MRRLSLFYYEDVAKKDLKYIDTFAKLPFSNNYESYITDKGKSLLSKLYQKYKKFE